jgi:hypothetical protein
MISHDQLAKCNSIDVILDIYENYDQSGTSVLELSRRLPAAVRQRPVQIYRVEICGGKSQPDSLAIRMASTRLRAPVFVIARDR